MLTIFTSKLGVVVTLLALLWVFSDVNQRFTNKNITLTKDKASYSASDVSLPQLSKPYAENLQKFINKYQTKIAATQEQSMGMSAKKQSKQNGLLNTLYIDNNKLQLKAVIQTSKESQKQLQALLLITNVNSGKQQIEKFSNNSSVYGYQLTIGKNTEVSLIRKTKQKIQKITLTMYAKKGFRKI
jgi:hypothetical protein